MGCSAPPALMLHVWVRGGRGRSEAAARRPRAAETGEVRLQAAVVGPAVMLVRQIGCCGSARDVLGAFVCLVGMRIRRAADATRSMKERQCAYLYGL